MTMVRRFARRVLAFSLIQGIVLCVLLSGFEPSPEAGYLAATFDKHRRLERTPPPRIILVGGSNVALGFRSDLLEEAAGRPVINMALMAGVGMEFMLNEIRDAVQKGDVVVLSFEYPLFSGGYDRDVTRELISHRPANLMHVGLSQLPRVLVEHGLGFFCQIARSSADAVIRPARWAGTNGYPFVRQGFNAWGDCTVHYTFESRLPPLGSNPYPPSVQSGWLPPGRVIGWLTSFTARCKEAGVRAVYSFPPQPEDYLSEAAPTIEILRGHIEKVPDLTILDSPEEQVYPRTQFYDSAYHLTKEGAGERTERLIRALKREFPEMDSSVVN